MNVKDAIEEFQEKIEELKKYPMDMLVYAVDDNNDDNPQEYCGMRLQENQDEDDNEIILIRF